MKQLQEKLDIPKDARKKHQCDKCHAEGVDLFHTISSISQNHPKYEKTLPYIIESMVYNMKGELIFLCRKCVQKAMGAMVNGGMWE